jgi:hypothetical protein
MPGYSDLSTSETKKLPRKFNLSNIMRIFAAEKKFMNALVEGHIYFLCVT